MEKSLLLTSLLLTNWSVYSQALEFSGDYKSYSTSFQDLKNPKNSFLEEAVNNIFIQVEDNEGIFVFQDDRYPDDILSYKIDAIVGTIVDGETKLLIYNCLNIHSAEIKSVQIVLYVKKDDTLNIMISDDSSDQVFFNLKKENSTNRN